MEIDCLGTISRKLKCFFFYLFDANMICFETMTMGGSVADNIEKKKLP